MGRRLESLWTRLTLRIPNEERSEAAQSSRLRGATTVPEGLNTEDLPDEVFERILEQLDPQHLCNAASTCRRWAYVTASERVWCSLYLRHPKMAGGSLGRFDLDELDPEDSQLRIAAEQQLQCCCCEQDRHSGWREICQKELLLPRLEPAHVVDDHADYALLKIVQLGDSGVGKTRFLQSFVDEERPRPELGSLHIPTIGVEFAHKMARLNNTAVKMQVWDTAGQERFRTITQAYYRGAAGFACMFDVTKRSSFDHIRDTWLKEAPDPGILGIPIVIIGIRHDQTTSRHRVVEPTEGYAMARDLQVSGNVEGRVRYTEANPMSGEGISRAMACLVEQILLNQEVVGPSSDSPLRPVPTKQSRLNSIAASLRRIVS